MRALKVSSTLGLTSLRQRLRRSAEASERRRKPRLYGIFVVAIAAAAAGRTAVAASDDGKEAAVPQSFYELSATKLSGEPADLKQYSGKVTLVVNTASKCGYTPQYKGLQALYTELAPRGFVVLGFPSNDFGGQEPGTAEEIKTFCELNYKVTFPMFSKVVTQATEGQSPIYSWLGRTGDLPKWNFSKYLIGRDGKVLAFFPSKVAPDAPELRQAIEQALR
jgi:glutathione peroxidase